MRKFHIWLVIAVLLSVLYVENSVVANASHADIARPTIEHTRYRDDLTISDQRIYDLILKSLDEDGAWVASPIVDERLLNFGYMVLYDHPEYAAKWPCIRFQTYGNTFRVRIEDTAANVPDSWYEARAEKWHTENNPAKAAFDDLSSMGSYASQGTDLWSDASLIYNQKACCQGYAIAYKRALDTLHIPNKILLGTNIDGIPHVQNAVYINDTWQVCDLVMGSDGWNISENQIVKSRL